MAKGALSAPLVRLPAKLTTGREIRSGGEGKIFEIAEVPDIVAKIYHRPPSPERQRKLRLMAQMDLPEMRAIAAWPIQTVGSGAKITGFVMPLVRDHKDVHLLYSPKSRREAFPNVDFRFVARAAANAARAFAVAHASGVVIGDVNYGGVAVSAAGDVKLLDCDSFQVVGADGEVYRCEVGMPEFLPPELAGKRLDEVVRTPNHDNFGLAVLVFRMLMLGRHPFVGRYTGYGEMTQERAMAEFRYAYGPRAEAMRMARPPGVPAVEDVAGPAVAAAFERAFDAKGPSGSRPGAAAWAALLDALAAELEACAEVPSHWSRGGRPCVWCAVEQASGISMFPRAEEVEAPKAPPAEVLRAVSDVFAVGLPDAEDLPEPEPELETTYIRFPRTLILAKIAIIIGSVWLAAKIDSSILAMAACWGGIKASNRLFRRRRRPAVENADELRAQRALLETVRTQSLAHYKALCADQAKDLAAAKAVVADARRRLEAIPRLRAKRVGPPNASRGELQLLAHLRRHRVADLKVSGVGVERRQTLIANGIETAADVAPGVVSALPGFGPVLEAALLDWRRRVEKGFVYDPRMPADRAMFEAARRELDAEQRKCEAEILRAPAEMLKIREVMLRRRERVASGVREATDEITKLNRALNGS